jgi:hypothetical protein
MQRGLQGDNCEAKRNEVALDPFPAFHLLAGGGFHEHALLIVIGIEPLVDQTQWVAAVAVRMIQGVSGWDNRLLAAMMKA